MRLSDDAALLSVTLQELPGTEPLEVLGADKKLLSQERLRRVVTLLEKIAKLVESGIPAMQHEGVRKYGFKQGVTPDRLVKKGCALLDDIPDVKNVMQLLGDLRGLNCQLPASIIAAHVAASLRDKEVPTLRDMLGAADDLSEKQKKDALCEPLFTPAPAGAMDGGSDDDGYMTLFLGWCDARTLRSLKAVSFDYGLRARGYANDAKFGFLQAPLWSTTQEGTKLAANLSTATNNKCVQLLRTQGNLIDLDPAVALPAHAATIIPLLEHEDYDVRNAARKTLHRLEPQVLALHAVAITQRLGHDNAGVQLTALQTLDKMEPQVLALHANTITPLLQDTNSDVRKAALQTLYKMEPHALSQHAADIVRLIADSVPDVRRAATQTISKINPQVLALHANTITPMLQDTNSDVRVAALETLDKLEPHALSQHAADIVPLVEHADLYVRVAAVQTMGVMKPQTLALHAQKIEGLLADSDQILRELAVWTLGKLEPGTLSLRVISIKPLLKDKVPDVRAAAVQTMGKMEPDVLKQHATDIVGLLEDGHEKVWFAAAVTLGKLGPDALKMHVKPLLKDKKKQLRLRALEALHHSKDLLQHAADIVWLIADSVPNVRWAAVQTMRKMDPQVFAQHETATRLRNCLGNKKSGVRVAALETLKLLKPQALSQYADDIVPLVEDADVDVRLAALTTLQQLEQQALSQHGAAIVQSLNAPFQLQRFINEAALQTLGKMEPRVLAQHAIAITQRLGHDNAGVRLTALQTLDKMEPGLLSQYASVIVKRLGDTNSDVRLAALEALYQLEPQALSQHAADINPLLTWLLKDAEEKVQNGARQVLQKLKAHTLGPPHKRARVQPATNAATRQ